MLFWKLLVFLRQMKKYIPDKNVRFILGVIMLVVMWQALSVYIAETTMVFPGPVETIGYTLTLLRKPYTYRCIFNTLLKMFVGFIISSFLAVITGILSGNNELFEDLLNPTIIALRSIPTASLVYLFIVLVGFRMAPMLLVVLICFPIIYQGVTEGIKNIPVEIIKASKVDGAGFLMNNFRVKLPLAMPYILTAMLSSFSLAFKIEIMAEVITGSTFAGIGSAISGARSSDPTNMIPIFAYSLIAVAVMLIIDFITSYLLKRYSNN